MRTFFKESELLDIYDKVMAAERLSLSDGITLFETPDLPQLSYLANWKSRQLHGNNTFYVHNQHLNPTNVCEYSCLFCSFRRDKGEDGAYTLSLEQIREKVKNMQPRTREIHIVSGLNPELPFSYYMDMLSIIKEERPEVNLKAFTAVEIDYFSNKFSMDALEVLEKFRSVGLDAMPGGGAEIFSPRIQKKLFRQKANADRWLNIHGWAHSVGIKTNATMLYGHIETTEERVQHLLRLRGQQDKSGGFISFIPLAYQHENNQLGNLKDHTANLDMRVFAVSRLILDNFPHIKAYWVTIGEHLAQLALSYGADELEGTVVEETIMHMAGTRKRGMTEKDLIRLIEHTGRVPVERDALYNVLENVLGKEVS